MKLCYSCFRQYKEDFSVCPYCGSPENTQPKEAVFLAPGTVLADRYIIGEGIRNGGFGILYKAWDTKLEVMLAVKEFFPSKLINRAVGEKQVIVPKKSEEEFEYRKARFLTEAQYMAKFGSHQAIPNVFGYFEENGTAYLVMEFLNGMALDVYLKQCDGRVDVDFAIQIANEVGQALIAMHEEGIIHKDVAPDNIFICSDKTLKIKLIDFGAAKLANASEKVLDIVLKPGYSPVEQYKRQDNDNLVGPWTDVYAFGATMYAILTGTKPDEATNRKIADEVVAVHVLNPDVPENISNAIMKAMAIEPHMRFRNVADFLAALNGEKKVMSPEKERMHKRYRRVTGIFVASVLVVLALVAVFALLHKKQDEEVLESAKITVWFSVTANSSEEDAMKAVFADFMEKNNAVEIEYRAIAEKEYENTIRKAAEEGTLPNLFECTGIDPDYCGNTISLEDVLDSEQAKECLFLDQFDRYYSDKKRIPLGIEVPMAYVITSGFTQTKYDKDFFTSVADFGDEYIVDSRYLQLLKRNLSVNSGSDASQFFDKEGNLYPILLSSSMIINEVRALQYEKKYVYFDASEIQCNFTYEWSISDGTKSENKAAKVLLSWMLGNVYQQKLMINSAGTNQIPEIPVNKDCFETKAKVLVNLSPIKEIYTKFRFDGGR